MKLLSKSPQETLKIAQDLARALSRARLSGRATILALKGDLGAGKTALTKALGAVLGAKEEITSPTFVLEKIYKLPAAAQFSHLVHIDAYRLDSADELSALGWDEIVAHHDNLVVIEWPERVLEAMPKTALTLGLKFVNDTTREITIPKKLVDVWPAKKSYG